MTAAEYVNAVLDEMPLTAPMRGQIATELRSHIAERVASGRALDDVLRQLGDPVALAESYLAAEPLVAAAIGDRALAKLIDLLVMLALAVPLASLLSSVAAPDALWLILCVMIAFGVTILLSVYTAFAEYHSGQTLGKRVRGLHVVHESGRRVSAGQALVRQLPMVLNIYWIDAIFALFTDRRQRAFELLSKTRVVVLSPPQQPAALPRTPHVIPGESR
jgi:uncharacterized RDD family membrane protein YckC